MKQTDLFKSWDEYKVRLKQKLAESTDDNLLLSAYTSDEIYGTLQILSEKQSNFQPV